VSGFSRTKTTCSRALLLSAVVIWGWNLAIPGLALGQWSRAIPLLGEQF
jgi:hypothetical protein